MAWKLKDNIKEYPENVPPVGTFWKHRRSSPIYLRISDKVGMSVLHYSKEAAATIFFSITDDGKVVSTGKSVTDIVILNPQHIEGLNNDN